MMEYDYCLWLVKQHASSSQTQNTKQHIYINSVVEAAAAVVAAEYVASRISLAYYPIQYTTIQ